VRVELAVAPPEQAVGEVHQLGEGLALDALAVGADDGLDGPDVGGAEPLPEQPGETVLDDVLLGLPHPSVVGPHDVVAPGS
jgi:hypothetical protein